jgi:hypothetical protein
MAVPAAGCPSLAEALDEDAQVQVLHAAKTSKVLAALASSSKQLCRVARCRVPVKSQVTKLAHAELVVRSHAAGRPPFSACTELDVRVDTLESCLIAAGVFSAAQQWAALQHVELSMHLSNTQLQHSQSLDYCSAGLLASLPALKQLRHLVLRLPDVGACSVAQLGQLVQLTHLELFRLSASAAYAAVESDLDEQDEAAAIDAAAEAAAGGGGGGVEAAAAAAVDLSVLSAMTNLVELVLWGPAVQPAAGGEGPFCFPSSLTCLDIIDPAEKMGGAACIPPCLTHLPGCPALQQLRIYYSLQQHHSAHPNAVVGLLAEHKPQLRKLEFEWEYGGDIQWDAQVAGLPAAAGPVDKEWHPDAALASLRGLESLEGGRWLSIQHEEHWQHLAQLTALTRLRGIGVTCVPHLLAGAKLSVLELACSRVELSGYDLGRLPLFGAGRGYYEGGASSGCSTTSWQQAAGAPPALAVLAAARMPHLGPQQQQPTLQRWHLCWRVCHS